MKNKFIGSQARDIKAGVETFKWVIKIIGEEDFFEV